LCTVFTSSTSIPSKTKPLPKNCLNDKVSPINKIPTKAAIGGCNTTYLAAHQKTKFIKGNISTQYCANREVSNGSAGLQIKIKIKIKIKNKEKNRKKMKENRKEKKRTGPKEKDRRKERQKTKRKKEGKNSTGTHAAMQSHTRTHTH